MAYSPSGTKLHPHQCRHLIVAEMRAGELLVALQSAVNGDAHWRLTARLLIEDINALRLPEPAFERLREIEAHKRAAEQMEDCVHGA